MSLTFNVSGFEMALLASVYVFERSMDLVRRSEKYPWSDA